MAAKTLTIDGKQVSAEEGATILQAATDAGIKIPTLCHLEGVYDVGACRLCLVEVTGVAKLLPACTTKVSRGHGRQNRQRAPAEIPPHDAGTALRRAQPRLRRVRGQRPLRTADARLFARAWTTCATITTSRNGAWTPRTGCSAWTTTAASFARRCVRVCWHIEGAGTKNVSGRGAQVQHHHRPQPAVGRFRDLHRHAANASCPAPPARCSTKARRSAEMERDRDKLEFIVNAREKKQWIV